MSYRYLMGITKNVVIQRQRREATMHLRTYYADSLTLPGQVRNKCVSDFHQMRQAFANFAKNLSTCVRKLKRELRPRAAQWLTGHGRRSLCVCSMYAKFRQCFFCRLIREKNRIRPFRFLLGAGFFSWAEERVTDKELDSCAADMDHVKNQLLPETLERSKGGWIREVGGTSDDGWELALSKKNFTVWRKYITEANLYAYKVLASCEDATPQSFLRVQLDIQYRKKWDNLVIEVSEVDKDDQSDSDVIRWIMYYPYPMTQREYIFTRRWKIDLKNNYIAMVSKSVDHPQVPETDQYVRADYHSEMIIKPHSGLNQKGFDYVLTYFDDYKGTVPSHVMGWAGCHGLPNFISKVHEAAKNLDNQKCGIQDRTSVWNPNPQTNRLPSVAYS